MTSDVTSTQHQLDSLRGILRDLGSVLVCYSGGIDSAFVLAVAHAELGERAIGMTASQPEPIRRRKRRRRAHCPKTRRGSPLRRFTRTRATLAYVQNGPDRCFHCKSELYDIAEAKRREWQLAVVVNGTNRDDLGDYRPGLEAAKNAGARSPLVEAGMTKSDVRAAAQAIGMDVWDKPAAACLSSRIPYGTSVTTERLAQIGGLEAELKALGFRQLRVRWHEKIARIEVALGELELMLAPGVREAVVTAGKKHGFQYVTLDLGGYRTGSHNEVLLGRALRIV